MFFDKNKQEIKKKMNKQYLKFKASKFNANKKILIIFKSSPVIIVLKIKSLIKGFVFKNFNIFVENDIRGFFLMNKDTKDKQQNDLLCQARRFTS